MAIVAEWANEAGPAEVARSRFIAAANAALELRAKATDLPEEARTLFLGSSEQPRIVAG